MPVDPNAPVRISAFKVAGTRLRHCKNRSKPAPDFGRKRQVISAESGT
jgi:hypothetical protein